MKDVDLKKLGTLRLCGGGALVALATWGVWAFCGGGFSASSGWESAFDGWRYGREDQKAASAALAAAGLDQWSWDDGRLLVPKNKKNEYQTALAEAGAYPKAPSESRRDAIREMGAFESETKIRMRELDACAFQLERTLERIDGIEYATVGVRARREQVGLTTKTVVTASIGVACGEDAELDANLLSAITVAAKHQLGVDANENLSILDLKAGKSYFGSEKLVGNGVELALAAEKERVEIYWRDKFLKTFDYMEGVRVSVAAELVVADPNDVARTEIGDVFIDLNDRSDSQNAAATENVATNGRATSAARRLAQVELGTPGKIEKPRPLATWADDASRSARNGAAFARLGNPVATRSPAAVEAQNLAEVERTSTGNGVLAVGATERRDAPKRGVVLAAFRQETEDGEEGQKERKAQTEEENAIKTVGTNARVESVAQNEKKKENNGTGESVESAEKRTGKVGGNERKKGGEEKENVRFRVRALAVRVGTPRGYVRRVAQNLKAENAVETFATDETTGDWSAFYRTTEQKIVAETKNVALLLLRPLAERNGWTENELTRSVAVDVFADPNDFIARASDGNPNGPFEVVANFGRVADVAERVAEETTVAPSTREDEGAAGAGTANETSSEETAADFWAVAKARVRELDAKTKAGVAAGVGILTILTLTAGAAAVRRRRKTVADLDEEESGRNSNGEERATTRRKEKKRNERKKRDASNGENGEDAALVKIERNRKVRENAERTDERQNGERRTVERNLRIARIGEGATAAQNAAFEQSVEETRNETETRRAAQTTEMRNASTALDLQNPQNVQNPQSRGWDSTPRGAVGIGGGNRRDKSSGFESFGNFSNLDDLDSLDDWGELDDDLLEIRSLIERERARVENETPETTEAGPDGRGAARRREALDLVARNPERAAASLRRWLRPGA